jgi:hypothetical protein
MRFTRFVPLGDDGGLRIQVDDDGQLSLVAMQGPAGPVSEQTVIVLSPISPDQAQEFVAFLNIARREFERPS